MTIGNDRTEESVGRINSEGTKSERRSVFDTGRRGGQEAVLKSHSLQLHWDKIHSRQRCHEVVGRLTQSQRATPYKAESESKMEVEDSNESEREEETTETELEKWKSIHSLLKQSVSKALEEIAILKAQKRYWLEQLAFNLNDAGKVEPNSTWEKSSDKNLPKVPKTASSAKKRKQQTGSVASNSKSKKKPRVKEDIVPRSVESEYIMDRQPSESSMATSSSQKVRLDSTHPPQHRPPQSMSRGIEHPEYHSSSARMSAPPASQFEGYHAPQHELPSSECHQTYAPPNEYLRSPWNAAHLAAARVRMMILGEENPLTVSAGTAVR